MSNQNLQKVYLSPNWRTPLKRKSRVESHFIYHKLSKPHTISSKKRKLTCLCTDVSTHLTFTIQGFECKHSRIDIFQYVWFIYRFVAASQYLPAAATRIPCYKRSLLFHQIYKELYHVWDLLLRKACFSSA